MGTLIATCQLDDVQGDTAKTLRSVAQYAARADKIGASILCFPECYYQGYTRDKVLAEQRAIDLDGPECKQLLERLSGYKVAIILGLIERAANKLFNTAVVIRNGKLVGKYRKSHPNEGIFVAGTEHPVFTIDNVRIGINICNDANYPAAAAELARSSAHVIFYPLNNLLATKTAEKWRDRHVQNLINRATQTRCWVISSDVIYEDSETIGHGFTVVVSPDGKVVAQAPELIEQMIIASI